MRRRHLVPNEPRLVSGDLIAESREIAEAVAQTLRNTAEMHARLAETYRRLAANSTGEKSRSYLARAQRYQELAQRAKRIVVAEEESRGSGR